MVIPLVLSYPCFSYRESRNTIFTGNADTGENAARPLSASA